MFSVREVAEQLHVTDKTVYRLVARGLVPVWRAEEAR